MNACPNCGADLRPNARFCTSCGFRLPETVEAPPPARQSPFETPSSSSEQWWKAAGLSRPPGIPDDEPAAGSAAPAAAPTPGEPVEVPARPEVTPPALPGWWRVQAVGLTIVPDDQDAGAGTGAAGDQGEPVATLSGPPEVLQDAVTRLQEALAALTAASRPEVQQAVARVRALAGPDAERDARIAGLAGAVATATDRPRDVDTMLELVNHLETIDLLLRSHADLRADALRLAGLVEETGQPG